MENITKICFKGLLKKDSTIHFFRTTSVSYLFVSSFEKGIAKLYITEGSKILFIAKLLAGCFSSKSNFESELKKEFNCSDETKLIGIQFEANDVAIMVTKENADEYKIYAEYMIAMLKRGDFIDHKRTVKEELNYVDEKTELEFKNDNAKNEWENFVSNEHDSYYEAVITYTRQWAKYMQYVMKKYNKSVFEIAESTSKLYTIDGCTGYICGAATDLLSKYWKYGDELRIWNEKRYGD